MKGVFMCQTRLKLNREVNECKPLEVGSIEGIINAISPALTGRGLHSSTSQLNLSRVRHKITPYTP